MLTYGDRIQLGRNGGSEMVFEPGVGVLSGSLAGNTPSSPVSDVHQVSVLLETLRALGHARVLQEVLALILDSAITLSGAERGFIMLAGARGDLEFRLARGKGKKTLDDAEFSKRSHTVPEEVFATGRTRVIPNLEEEGLAQAHDKTLTLGIRQVLCVPLHLVRFVDAGESRPDERLLGVMYLDSQRIGVLLSETVGAGLETLAAEAAVAIENARLYRETAIKERLEQELRIAADIQRILLPREPIDKPCVEAAADSKSCQSIGGDFFDYAHQDDCRFAFTLGDVAGKGAPAALLSSLLLGMFSLATQGDDPPASVVSRVNGALCHRAVEARFATLFYGVLDRHGCLRYCNAGHNPPFVIGADGIRRLETGGPVVGLLEQPQYRRGRGATRARRPHPGVQRRRLGRAQPGGRGFRGGPHPGSAAVRGGGITRGACAAPGERAHGQGGDLHRRRAAERRHHGHGGALPRARRGAMNPGQPSRTAVRVALRRAAHQILDTPVVFQDPLALQMIGREVAGALQADPARFESQLGASALRAFLAVRSRIAEDALAGAFERGVRQYVVLGAGMDTYAYRQTAPQLRVFEVDEPATQAWKRTRLNDVGLAEPSSLTFVPMDFEHQSLDEELRRAVSTRLSPHSSRGWV